MVRVVKRPEERRREIVAASRSLFLSQGYESTTIQDVMNMLQIAKGTTYHYFKSKEELLEAVVEEMVTEYVETLERALAESKGNALERMKILITRGRVSFSSGDPLDHLHRANNRELHGRLLAITIARVAPLYAGVISQGCKEGVFDVAHPLECAEILLAGVQFVTDIGCYRWSSEDLERRTKAIPDLIENQLNAAKGVLSALFTQNKKKE